MSFDMEKLTQAVTVKLSQDTAQQANYVAESCGMELSEYIRHLVTSDLARERARYSRSHQVFAKAGGASMYTVDTAV